MKWKKTKIPEEYNFEGKILEFSQKDHPKESLFCRCSGGFGAVNFTSGRMIIGDFFPTLDKAIKNEGGKGSNTKAFPIAQYEQNEVLKWQKL